MIALSALFAALAVGCGAFGAHALKSLLSQEMLAVWNTASHYHLVHAVALVAMAVGQRSGLTGIVRAWWLLFAGTAWFSGSLYALSLTGTRWLGALTPVGGLLMLAGWGTLAWSFRKRAPE